MGCMECIEACVFRRGKMPRRVQPGPQHAQAGLHPLPAGGAPGGGHRPGRLHRVPDRASARRPASKSAPIATPSTSQQTETFDTVEVGTIILATGFKTFDPKRTPALRLRDLSPTCTPPWSWSGWSTPRGPPRGTSPCATGAPRRRWASSIASAAATINTNELLLAGVLHVLLEAGPPDQGEDRGGDLQLLHRHPRPRQGHRGVLQPGRRGRGPLHPRARWPMCTRRPATPGG